MNTPVRFGVDQLAEGATKLGRAARVGLVTNDAARLSRDVSVRSRIALLDAGVPLVRLFGPEHGLSGQAADGVAVTDNVDSATGLPVVSLYGERMRPAAGALEDLDAVLFDVPDVGARFYTYTWTLYHVMAACEQAGVDVVVLDRPNPLGGDLLLAEGPILDLAHRSFVGDDAIPIRHQLTLGELARLWRRERFPRVRLTVIPCAGWTRAMTWGDTGLPWVPTSPSMPSIESVQLYPGTCLFEATNLGVGRGTDTPFQVIGAPWLDSHRVLRALEKSAIRGVAFSETTFTPSISPYKGEPCRGLRMGVSSATDARPVAIGLQTLATIAALHRTHFRWARYPTAANPVGEGHLERLLGRGDVRHVLDETPDAVDATCIAAWTSISGWRERVQDVLCYD